MRLLSNPTAGLLVHAYNKESAKLIPRPLWRGMIVLGSHHVSTEGPQLCLMRLQQSMKYISQICFMTHSLCFRRAPSAGDWQHKQAASRSVPLNSVLAAEVLGSWAGGPLRKHCTQPPGNGWRKPPPLCTPALCIQIESASTLPSCCPRFLSFRFPGDICMKPVRTGYSTAAQLERATLCFRLLFSATITGGQTAAAQNISR